MKCEHSFNDEIQCCLEEGHELQHREYVKIFEEEGESKFEIYEWDDDGERIRMIEQYRLFEFNEGGDPMESINAAFSDARSSLNAGDVFEIRRKFKPVGSCDYGRSLPPSVWRDGVSWHRVPLQKYYMHRATPVEPLVDYGVDGGHIEPGGYILLARIKA